MTVNNTYCTSCFPHTSLDPPLLVPNHTFESFVGAFESQWKIILDCSDISQRAIVPSVLNGWMDANHDYEIIGMMIGDPYERKRHTIQTVFWYFFGLGIGRVALSSAFGPCACQLYSRRKYAQRLRNRTTQITVQLQSIELAETTCIAVAPAPGPKEASPAYFSTASG